MELNAQEKNLFASLSGSESGRQLSAYLKRVQDWIRDCENWKEGDTKESAMLASRAIQECLIDKIRQKSGSGVSLNESE